MRHLRFLLLLPQCVGRLYNEALVLEGELMGDEWWRHLRGRPFYWVVDGTHPAASVWVMRHVMERPAEAPALRAAGLALAEWEPVEALRTRLGAAEPTEPLWEPRYEAQGWALRLLAELGVSGEDERIAPVLDAALDAPIKQGDAATNLPAMVAHAAGVFGFGTDERVGARLAWIGQRLREGTLPDETEARADWLVQAALALAAQPEGGRNAATLARLASFLQTLHPDALPRYARYSFPTFDQPHDLTLACAALRLGLAGEWLRPWIARIAAAQDEQGLWRLTRALPAPGDTHWEAEGGPSRWLSAQALYALRAYYGE